jgi:hypothetical protein
MEKKKPFQQRKQIIEGKEEGEPKMGKNTTILQDIP